MAKNADVQVIFKAKNDAKSAIASLAADLKSMGVAARTVNSELGKVDKAVDKLAGTTQKLSTSMGELSNARSPSSSSL